MLSTLDLKKLETNEKESRGIPRRDPFDTQVKNLRKY